MKKETETRDFRHPLADWVLDLMSRERYMDEAKLSCAMAGCAVLKVPRSSRDGMKAYLLVAEDILGNLLRRGELIQTEAGWYVIPPLAGD